MKRHAFSVLLPLLALALAATLPAIATGRAADGTRGIRGEVVSVDSSGENVTVRCRGGVEYKLALGPETGAGQFRVGDPVRARINADAAQGNVHRVQWMQNPGTGQRFGAGSAGVAVKKQDRTRLRDGSGDGTPDRDRVQAGNRQGQGSKAGRMGAGYGSGRGGGSQRSNPSCGARGSGRR